MVLPLPAFLLLNPTLEQHDRDVDAPAPRFLHAGSQPAEEGGIELAQVELGLAVPRNAGSGARPGQRRHDVSHGRFALLLDFPRRLLLHPQPEEIVMVLLEKIEVGGVVEGGRRITRADVGPMTPRGRAGSREHYFVVLPSVGQTCSSMGVDFLDRLRSVEKVVHVFTLDASSSADG